MHREVRKARPTRLHGQRLVSVIACRNAQEWLTKDPRRRIEFHWCPSHEGIEWNDVVDEDRPPTNGARRVLAGARPTPVSGAS